MVGPTQCGKTFLVENLLNTNRIQYPSKKPRGIWWYYNQWQDRYEAMQSTLGRGIQFFQGLPDSGDDLREINPKFNNILEFDDLMSQATESPMISLLFTQGRHRNSRVILLLQNMFPKGKFNTDTSQNTQYMALFRSPSDRKQIGIMAGRMFDKNSSLFMAAYAKETERPFGYILVDNSTRPDTTSDKQVLSDIFGSCHCYPTLTNKPRETFEEQPTTTVQDQPVTLKPTVRVKSSTSNVKQTLKVKSAKPNVKPTVKVNPTLKLREKARKRKADPAMESVRWKRFALPRKKNKIVK